MSDENRYFQWVAGDRRGEILVLDKIEEEDGETYLLFRDESRINTELVAEINEKQLTGKMMAEVSDYNNVWKFKEIDSGVDKKRIEQDWESQVKYDVPSVEEIIADASGNPVKKRKKKIKLIPPRPTKNKFGKLASTIDLAAKQGPGMSTTNQGTNVQQAAPNEPQHDVNDPVWLMMDKAKKFDTEVEMNVTISLPTKSLYDVAKESFEEGGEKVIEYIISNLDNQKLKDSLKLALKEAYGEQEINTAIALPEKRMQKDLPWQGELGEPVALEDPVIGDQVAEELKETE